MARRSGEREKVRGPRQAAALHFSPLPRGEGDQPQRFTACYTIERRLTIPLFVGILQGPG